VLPSWDIERSAIVRSIRSSHSVSACPEVGLSALQVKGTSLCGFLSVMQGICASVKDAGIGNRFTLVLVYAYLLLFQADLVFIELLPMLTYKC
jgi:hypothetical protein